jgi:2',3'-cyclic-nucleotide 2'-phosphodiesterase (5'-nucleotidase family)
MAWYLKHIEKVDMVIALTHIGYIKDDVNDIKLAETSEDIDMIIGGHSHTVINPDDPKGEKSRFLNTVGNTILVSQTGTQGVFVGEIDIDLDTKQADYKLISVDKRFDNRIDKDLSEYLASYRQKVDSVKHVYVGRSKVDIPRRSPAQVNLMTDFVKKCGDKMAKNVDFALLNIGGLRQGIMKGRLSEGELIETIPFSNYIQVVDIKGSDLQELFDICAVRRHVGVSDEARVTYDTIANRANVTINRAALDPERTYRVATIDYLVNGGDYLKPLKRAMVIATSPRMMYEDFINEFKNGQFKSKALNPSTESRTVIDSTK